MELPRNSSAGSASRNSRAPLARDSDPFAGDIELGPPSPHASFSSSVSDHTAPDTEAPSRFSKSSSGSSTKRDGGGADSAGESESSVFDLYPDVRGWRRYVLKRMDGPIYLIAVIILTMWVLFANDLRILTMPEDAKDPVGWLYFAIFLFYVFELVLNCICRPKYLWSFFFWLEFLATLSLIPFFPFVSNLDINAELGNSSRLARIIRATRIARVVRAAKIARVSSGGAAKSFQRSVAEKFKSAKSTMLTKLKSFGSASSEFDEQGRPRQSVTRRISASFRKKSSVSPQDNEAAPATHQSVPSGTGTVFSKVDAENSSASPGGANSSASFSKSFLEQPKLLKGRNLKVSQLGQDLADLTTAKVILVVMVTLVMSSLLPAETMTNADDFAMSELISLSADIDTDPMRRTTFETVFNFTRTDLGVLEAKFGTVFYYVDRAALASLDDSFIFDVERGDNLIRYDIEDRVKDGALVNIIGTVLLIVILTVASMLFNKDADNFVVVPIERMIMIMQEFSRNPLLSLRSLNDGTGRKTEAVLIERTLIKLTNLLQIAYGEAGAEIISRNVSPTGKVEAVVPGKKVRAIFGFCDIRSFTTVTESLEEDVMVFVNYVAKIVHGSVKTWGGHVNKNIGDAWLLTWKLEDGDNESAVADNALNCFHEIVQAIEAPQVLEELNRMCSIQTRMPEFKGLGMGFGLHVGWAIQGAIGSKYKIDVSYLSPHVNLASRLESATKQFGVPVLLSDEFHSLLSRAGQRQCRLLDRVTFKGSNRPMRIYSLDAHRDSSEINRRTTKVFSKAVEMYIEGDWENAIRIIEKCKLVWGTDMQCDTLLAVMESGVPGDNWRGFRALDEK